MGQMIDGIIGFAHLGRGAHMRKCPSKNEQNPFRLSIGKGGTHVTAAAAVPEDPQPLNGRGQWRGGQKDRSTGNPGARVQRKR